MSRFSARSKRAFILLGLLVISFALYAGAEAGSSGLMMALLVALVAFMVLTIIVG